MIISNYQGASLLIMTRDKEGQLHVLLGKRLNRPGKNQWSFPGGQRAGKKRIGPFDFKYFQYKAETLAQTAIRETDEELVRWPGAPDLPRPDEIPCVWWLKVPFFSWSTFLWFTANPELKLPRNNRDREFSELSWFRTDALPQPVHFGVRSALGNAERKIRKQEGRRIRRELREPLYWKTILAMPALETIRTVKGDSRPMKMLRREWPITKDNTGCACLKDYIAIELQYPRTLQAFSGLSEAEKDAFAAKVDYLSALLATAKPDGKKQSR